MKLNIEIEIEINTHEISPAGDVIKAPFEVANSWFTGAVDVLTFTPEELVSTKLRTLFQRRRGRDLFDLWLALTQVQLSPDRIVEMFSAYRPDGYTADRAVENLQAKVASETFRTDLDLLVTRWPDDYNIEQAAQLVIDKLLSRMP